MKVIVAGLSKTGTKSMQFALKELGYNVYDFMENYMYYGKKWEKIFAFGGTTDDFYEMYKDVDAVTDCPAAYFWDEIHKAFPNAKVRIGNLIKSDLLVRIYFTKMIAHDLRFKYISSYLFINMQTNV